ncbi:zinc finger protein 791 [Drosophila elegans]|uniref:zinc finger protein 791 n=1 Tax=Drosophila elegans TaxID=30023 RepID=UPI0007E86D10|nr:zinc finger protein 791 [Drosophila elegans]XP_017110990.1 zinc finger protein 791 [Drosophila elegans]
MESRCQFCKLRPGLLVKRGDSVPKTLCLQCLHLDTFGTQHPGVQTKVKDEILDEEPFQGEYFIITECKEEPALQTCRVCMLQSENMVNIFDNTLDSSDIPIATLISQSTGLRVEKGDSFPETICPTCLEDAHNASATMRASSEDYKKIGDQVKEEIKEEMDDEILVRNEPIEDDPYEEVPNKGINERNSISLTSDIPNQELKEEDHFQHKEPPPTSQRSSSSLPTKVQSRKIPNRRKKSQFLPQLIPSQEEKNAMKFIDQPPHRCPQCPKIFLHKPNFIAHLRTHTETNIEGNLWQTCPKCPKVYQQAVTLYAHIQEHKAIEASKPAYECPKCPKTFSTAEFLKYHIRSHEAGYSTELTGESPYKCPICSKKFLHQTFFMAHMKTHETEKAVLAIKCVNCKRPCFEQEDLISHICGSDTFTCSYCLKMLPCRYVLRNHIRSSHMGEGPFQCDQCERPFAKYPSFEAHVGEQACLKYFDTATLKFQCPHCPLSFLVQKDCDAHVGTHLRTGPYECNTCNIFFSFPIYLKMHEGTHRKKGPYPCTHCSRTFGRRYVLKRHILDHRKKARNL